ncbi:hypothetical protein EJ03DRAFT_352091 [Teratosphaeria nubilosa]|uniref:DUF7730 domain-containing protein n=1 Tax=Teratosphaeria nubilosa TaxID=161662 RepID=A0A6G1L8I3_9PEZI|nr:hypothetical protein EJ03DRAFT_352091 [Teratosphaeria nubilosa]
MASGGRTQKAPAKTDTSSKNSKPKLNRASRPRKVLAAKKVDPKLDRIYRENATNSPLLRLPPELRNRIWVMVLGGRVLHMFDRSRKPRVIICNHSLGDKADAQRIKAIQRANCEVSSEDIVTYEGEYKQRHGLLKKTCTAIDDALSLQLLQTSRSIHQEAALIPYKHNVFSFQSVFNLSNFLKEIVLAQSSAIENITMVDTVGRMLPSKTVAKLLETKLRGLKHMTWFLHLYDSQRARAGLDETVTVFKKLPLQTSTVAVTQWVLHYPVESATLCLELATELEQKLLAGS